MSWLIFRFELRNRKRFKVQKRLLRNINLSPKSSCRNPTKWAIKKWFITSFKGESLLEMQQIKATRLIVQEDIGIKIMDLWELKNLFQAADIAINRTWMYQEIWGTNLVKDLIISFLIQFQLLRPKLSQEKLLNLMFIQLKGQHKVDKQKQQ